MVVHASKKLPGVQVTATKHVGAFMTDRNPSFECKPFASKSAKRQRTVLLRLLFELLDEPVRKSLTGGVDAVDAGPTLQRGVPSATKHIGCQETERVCELTPEDTSSAFAATPPQTHDQLMHDR